MEQLGFDSLWVWITFSLGVEPNFPIIEALTLLTATLREPRRSNWHRSSCSAFAQSGLAREAAFEHGSLVSTGGF
jgi:hypothetical protein